MRQRRIVWPAALVLLWTTSASAGDYDKLAASLARGARAHGRTRVAVLPFQSIGGKGSTSGHIVAERLLGPLTADGSIQVVERALLETVMREQQLQYSGVVDQRSLKELGRVLNADALVTGAVIALRDEKVEVVARLIDANSAQILAVADARVEQDWNESMFDDASWAGPPPPSLPSFDLAAAGSDWGFACARAEETTDELERGLVDLKARYWAQRIRAGLDPRTLKKNPGSEIRSREIRAQFYARLKARMGAPSPDLSQDEIARMKDMMERLSRLGGACGDDDGKAAAARLSD